MADMFLSEIDGGALAQGKNGDIATDSGLQSPTYSLLFGGNTPLDALRGGDHKSVTFEEVLDVKINIQNLTKMEVIGTKKVQPIIAQGLAKSVKILAKNTGLGQVTIYGDYILLDGSQVSEKIAVFENGVMV
jgi:hypothetical protein